MPGHRCMLVFHKDSLLGNGMRNLLSEEADLEVLIFKVESESKLLQAVKRWAPLVLVIEAMCLEENQGLLSRLLMQREGLRVIVIGMRDNALQVFDRQTVQVRELSDFLSTIQSKPGLLVS